MKELIEIKKKIKKKNPDFSRTDSHKKPKLSKKWRKPKGLQNKMRLQKRGYKVIVKAGYKTPSKLQGMGADGKLSVHVSNVSQLKNVGKNQKIMISSNVGTKKKIKIIEEAKKQNIEVSNFKDADAFVKSATKKFEDKKSQKLEKHKNRKEKKKELIKKPKKKKKDESVEEKIDKEEKKQQEKKEKDKLLIQKEQ